MKRVLLSLAVASFAFAGVVAATPAEAKKIAAKYYCNKGMTLKVVFQGNKATVTPKGGKTVTLPQGMAADGFYYVKGKYSLRGRGDNATWSAGLSKPLSCTAR